MMFVEDPKRKYLLNTSRMNDVDVGLEFQATKFPVFKDAASKWSYDYASAYRQKFKATELWNPAKMYARSR
jgi:hypothetical protein